MAGRREYRQPYSLFKDSKSKFWQFWYWDGDTRRQRSSGKVKKWEAEQEAKRFTGDGAHVELLLKDFASGFFDDDSPWVVRRRHARTLPSPAVVRDMRGYLKNHIIPGIGELNLYEIGPAEIEAWLFGLDRSEQTRRHVLFAIGEIFKEAVRDKRLTRNPVELVERGKLESVSRDAFTDDELDKLFPKTIEGRVKVWGDLRYATLTFLLYNTGMRIGEARARRWKDWREKDAVIEVLSSLRGREVRPVKGGEDRLVPLIPSVQEMLQAYHEDTAWGEPDDYIFYGGERDLAISTRSVDRRLIRVLRELEIKTDGRVLVLHSMRHTFTTRLAGEIPEKVLQQLTGHKSVKMDEHYTHKKLEENLAQVTPHNGTITELLEIKRKEKKS